MLIIRLLKGIHKSFIQKLQAVINLVREIYYEQVFLSRDFDGCWKHHLVV